MAHSDGVFISRAITRKYVRAGLCETLITTKTYVNPFSETSMLNLPSSLFVSLLFSFSFALAHCFGRFLSVYNRCSVLVLSSLIPRFVRRRSSLAAARPRGIGLVYGTCGGRYVLWLIVLLSLTYFQFTAAARRFASWLSIVRDERCFMCHPEYSAYARLAFYPRDIPAVSNTISDISS